MKRENSRDALRQAALELFAAKGYEAVSPNDVVERVGVTKPTLYHFFGSKEGLLEAVLEPEYRALDAALAGACVYKPHPDDYDRDVYPVLLEVARVLFAFARAHRDFYLMCLSLRFAPPSSKPAEVAERYHLRHYAILEALFASMAGTHKNLRGKEQASAWLFLAALNAQIGAWHRGLGKLDAAAAHTIVRQFMHGLFA